MRIDLAHDACTTGAADPIRMPPLICKKAEVSGAILVRISDVGGCVESSHEISSRFVWCVCEQVLKITIGVPEEEQVSLIGPAYKGKNKWQNGFLGRDNAVRVRRIRSRLPLLFSAFRRW